VTDRAQARPTGRAPPWTGRGATRQTRARIPPRAASGSLGVPALRGPAVAGVCALGGLGGTRDRAPRGVPDGALGLGDAGDAPPAAGAPWEPAGQRARSAARSRAPRRVRCTAREAPCARRRLPGGVWSRRGRARARAHAAQGPRGGGPRGLRRCPGVRSCPGVRVGPCPDALLTWLWSVTRWERVLCGFAWLQTSLPDRFFRLMNNSG